MSFMKSHPKLKREVRRQVKFNTIATALAVTMLVPLAGCGNMGTAGNAANAAGNAAGFVGNEVGNTVRQGANAVGNITGMGPHRGAGAMAGNGAPVAYHGHSVIVDSATKTVRVRMDDMTSGNAGRVGAAASRAMVGNGNGLHIAVPTGWTIDVSRANTAGNAVSIVPYVGRDGRNAAGMTGGTAGAVAGRTAPTPGTAGTAGSPTRGAITTHVFKANHPGQYAIVTHGARGQVLDVITVSDAVRMPTISANNTW